MCVPPRTFRMFSYLLPLEVFIIFGDGVAIFGDCVHRFALLLPALGSQPRGVFVPRKGQIGSDAVPDAVAHHAVTVAVCADQLFPMKRADEDTKELFHRETCLQIGATKCFHAHSDYFLLTLKISRYFFGKKETKACFFFCRDKK